MPAMSRPAVPDRSIPASRFLPRDQVHRDRVLRVQQIVIYVVYSFHFNISFNFKLFKGFSSSRLKGLSFAAFVTNIRFDLVGLPLRPGVKTPSARTSSPNTPTGFVGQISRLVYFSGTQTDICPCHVEERCGIKLRLFRQFLVLVSIYTQRTATCHVNDSRQVVFAFST